MKISLCTILKNEGKTIYRMLESCKCITDQWVVGIDNKCTDNTKEEVERFFSDNQDLDSIVYEYEWKDNFAQARNYGMDKATGDFILIMDGHEFFPENWYHIVKQQSVPVSDFLTKLKDRLDPETMDEVFVTLYQQPFNGQVPNNFFLQPRFYRNDPKIRYGRATHNVIQGTKLERQLHAEDIILIHDAPEENRAERAKQRIEMNIKNLETDIDGNIKDTRSYFYLGNTYMEAKEWNKAIEAFSGYLKHRKDDQSEKYQVLIHKALCHREKEENKTALQELHEAVRMDPFRRDALVIIGDIYLLQEEYEKAIYYYNLCIQQKPDSSRMFQNGAVNTWLPYRQLARCYEKLGNPSASIGYLKAANQYLNDIGIIKEIQQLSGQKVKVYIIDHVGSFSKDINTHLSKYCEVIQTEQYVDTMALWADVIWVEWADQNAVIASNEFPKKTIIRIHGYENYINDTKCKQINFNACKKVIFVAKHIKEDFEKKYGVKDSVVIYNGVDTDKFYIKNKNRPHAIGYAGFLNSKKNPGLLLELIKDNPNVTFNLRVNFQDVFWKAAYDNALKDYKNVVYHGRYENLNDFWQLNSHVLSTSIIESFSFNIAEAMSAGCKPIINNWRGASDIYDDKYIYNGFIELSNAIEYSHIEIKDEMAESRHYIKSKYSLKKMLSEIDRIIK